MRGALDFLAARRWAGVGLAVVIELSLLATFAGVPSAAVGGIPAAVAASIGSTVAVVFGVADGIAVAFVGAMVFAALGGLEPGELAALAVWPAMVGAAGVFARRVGFHRTALRRLVRAHEEERRMLALTLHDQSAQSLAAALMALRAGGATADPARALITKTIQELREVAVYLSPKALEDYGLRPALTTLAAVVSLRAQIDACVSGDWEARLSDEAERALFRLVQAALGESIARNARSVEIALNREGDRIVVTVAERGGPQPLADPVPPEPTSEHLRVLGARVNLKRSQPGFVLRAELPALAFARQP